MAVLEDGDTDEIPACLTKVGCIVTALTEKATSRSCSSTTLLLTIGEWKECRKTGMLWKHIKTQMTRT
ncbi:hypothetical protein CEXT_443981 [Caerostris extrusa]|uniref:Uncharacterized protein n=1 Tax=Caerostris extrusa TaxID=172846 RepID=A0AAV4SLS5_CAEEX|nr:hypothetical protein CEXT_443981 [Caerostris extrusa]